MVMHSSTLRIACRGFADDEVAALRRLLGLLQSHLPRPWALVGGAEAADVLVVNLDADRASADAGGTTMVGCALKPGRHPAGTLYRPIRAYQLLALLSGHCTPSAPQPADTDHAGVDGWRYRLRTWPAKAMEWPHEWWEVMAAIRGAHHSPAEIAVHTGVAMETVCCCVGELARLDALDREPAFVHADVPAAPVQATRWRALTQRVGQILGFAR